MTTHLNQSVKDEIISSVLDWIYLDPNKLLSKIRNRYNIPDKEAESMLQDSALEMVERYHRDLFTIDVTLLTTTGSIESYPKVSKEGGVLANDFQIGVDALRRARAWISKRLIFKAKDYHKTRNRQRKYPHLSLDKFDGLEEVIASHETVESVLEATVASHTHSEIIQYVISDCIVKLSGRERQVALLLFHAKATGPEIAEQLQITEKNVRSIKHRALKKIRVMLINNLDLSGL